MMTFSYFETKSQPPRIHSVLSVAFMNVPFKGKMNAVLAEPALEGSPVFVLVLANVKEGG